MDNAFLTVCKSTCKRFSLIHILIALLLPGVASGALAAPDLSGHHATQPAKRVQPEKYVQPEKQKPSYFVNVNTADADKLCHLDGIGPVKAAAIVEYRNQHGPFKSVEELADVKGIGDKFIQKNRGRIALR